MNHLAILQWAVTQANISGTAPADVTGLSGAQARMVQYVDAAWTEIQNMRNDWDWLRRSVTLTLTADDGEYTLTDLSLNDKVSWFDRDSFWLWSTTAGEGESRVQYVDWEDWVAREGQRSITNPTVASGVCRYVIVRINPVLTGGGTLYFYPPPAGAYEVRCLYYRKTEAMGDASYTPDMPSEYHLAIAWYAIHLHAMDQGDTDLAMHAMGQHQNLIRRMEETQLGPLYLGNNAFGPTSRFSTVPEYGFNLNDLGT